MSAQCTNGNIRVLVNAVQRARAMAMIETVERRVFDGTIAQTEAALAAINRAEAVFGIRRSRTASRAFSMVSAQSRWRTKGATT